MKCTFVKVADGYKCSVCNQDVVISETPNITRKCQPNARIGPGTELSNLLQYLHLTAKPSCNCKKHIRQMNRMGCDWCEKNEGKIVGWLKTEAKKQKLSLVFSEFVVLRIVRLAIRRARSI